MADTAKRAGDYFTDPDDNDAASPDGSPEGQAPSTVNNVIREIMARLAFNHGDRDIYDPAPTGSSGNFVATITGANVGLNAGRTVKFKANHTPASTATLQVNSLTAKAIRKANDAALVSGDIVQNQIVTVVYDAVLDHWLMTSPTGNAASAVISALAAALTATAAELNEALIPFTIPDGSADTSYFIPVGHAGTVSKIYTVIDGAVSTADITITSKIGGVSLTDGAITIATAGSAAGDKDECSPSANNVFNSPGGALELAVTGGGSGGSPRINGLIVITR